MAPQTVALEHEHQTLNRRGSSRRRPYFHISLRCSRKFETRPAIASRGTHQGEFMGIAPTGREVTWTETHVGRFENGKLVEHWGNSDDLGMMQQIGAVPEPGEQGVEPSH